jgi:hypothetical protein
MMKIHAAVPAHQGTEAVQADEPSWIPGTRPPRLQPEDLTAEAGAKRLDFPHNRIGTGNDRRGNGELIQDRQERNPPDR